LDCSKLKKLGWKAKMKLEQGIKESYLHYIK
jgi:nucleoside-diphosphate-sugar epimerase